MTTKKKYKVVGYDTFSHEEFPCGNFATKEAAIMYANAHSGQMTLMYVYDRVSGQQIHNAGSY